MILFLGCMLSTAVGSDGSDERLVGNGSVEVKRAENLGSPKGH